MKKIENIDSDEDIRFLRRREPFKFMLWLGIFGMSLMFFILTFIYSTRRDDADWVNFPLPTVFSLSTVLIVLSSITLHFANNAIEQERFMRYRFLLGSTFGLGAGFILLQFAGWLGLQQAGVFLKGNPSGSFLYLISGLHITHLVGGMLFLGYALIEALRYRQYVDSFIYSVNPPNQLRLKLITRYWHFVDVLWIYLFCFFLFQHS